MGKHTFLSGLFLFLALTSCIDPYDPQLVGGERYLVFDGVLTDGPGPYRFTLSLSAGYNSTESVFDQRVTGAELTVTDDRGVATQFVDAGQGSYVSPGGFRGQAGRSYALRVRYKEQTYQSEPELMQPVPAIDSVYWAYNPQLVGSILGHFAVSVDLTDPANAENYYQWDWVHYGHLDYCLLLKPTGYLVRPANRCCTEDCWEIVRSDGQILLASDRLINGNRLVGQVIAKVPFDDISPYYLAIGQQSLSREAYQYWQTIQALTGNVGGVFDKTPATLRGNIRNQKADGLPMLGYFQVSARQQRIVYINRLGVGQPLDQYTNEEVKPCEPCRESPYRTTTKPEGWR